MAGAGTSGFAGVAGQVVRELLTARAVLRLLPYLALTVGLGGAGLVLAYFVLPPSPVGHALLAVVLASPVMGRDALLARDGAPPEAGAVVHFATRFTIVLAALGAPLVALSDLGDLTVALPAAPGAATGWLSAATWPRTIALCLVTVWGLFALQAALLVAARAEGLLALGAPRTWRWLLGDAARELPVVMAALLGGTALFFLTVTPAALLVALGVVRLHPLAGVVCGLLGYLAPLAAGCLLAARLAGAVAARATGEPVEQAARQTAAGLPLSASARQQAPLSPAHLVFGAEALAPPGLTPAELTSGRARLDAGAAARARLRDLPGGEALDYIAAIQGLAPKADADLAGAIADGERLLAGHPGSAGVLAELAKLYRRDGRAALAIDSASRAITLAIQSGASPVAVELFVAFEADRSLLSLGAETLEALAKALRFRGLAAEADVCAARAGELRPPAGA